MKRYFHKQEVLKMRNEPKYKNQEILKNIWEKDKN